MLAQASRGPLMSVEVPARACLLPLGACGLPLLHLLFPM